MFNLALSLRQALNLFTFMVLIYGIFQFKSFLNQNFVEHDTELKSTVNRALNGQIGSHNN